MWFITIDIQIVIKYRPTFLSIVMIVGFTFRAYRDEKKIANFLVNPQPIVMKFYKHYFPFTENFINKLCRLLFKS